MKKSTGAIERDKLKQEDIVDVLRMFFAIYTQMHFNINRTGLFVVKTGKLDVLCFRSAMVILLAVLRLLFGLL